MAYKNEFDDGKKENVDTSLDSEEFQDLVNLEFEKEYDKKTVNKIFYLMFFCSVSVNLDHGSLPACSEEIKSKMDILNFGFGALGTVVYFGLTLGSLLGAQIYSDSKNIKFVLMLSLSVMAVTLIVFALCANFRVIVVMRFIAGFCQIFTIIFVPLWADAFGNERQKSVWITAFAACSVIGIFIGYSLTSWMVAQFSFEYSFIIAATFTIPLVLSLYLTDPKFLDLYSALQHRKNCRSKLIQELKSSPYIQKEEDDQIDSSAGIEMRNSQISSDRNFETMAITESTEESPKLLGAESTKELTFKETLSQLYTNSDYMVLMMAITTMYFITAGVLFWTPNYMDQVLGASKEETVRIFSFVAATGPLSGFIVSGKVVSYFGGANTVAAQKAIMVNNWIGILIVIPIPFLSECRIFGVFIWILLFCGAFVIPPFTIIMLSVVPDHLRASSNSIANTCYNFLGWMPPPAVYGLISNLLDGNENIGSAMSSRVPMAFVVYMMIIPTSCLQFFFKRKHKIINENKVRNMKEALEQSKKTYES